MEKVYLSSTYEDLKHYRVKAINALRDFGDKFLVVSMETYSPDNQKSIERCLQDVTRCDVFILLVGKSYGSEPMGHSGKSFTRMEYEKARELHKIIYQFRISAKGSDPGQEQVESPGDDNQESFIKELNQYTHFITDCKDEADLEKQILICMGLHFSNRPILYNKELLLEYCDRERDFRNMKHHLLKEGKQVCFIYGNRRIDYPDGLVDRFYHEALDQGSAAVSNIQITDIFDSKGYDPANCEYVLEALLENDAIGLANRYDISCCNVAEFITTISSVKKSDILLSFYYDFEYDYDTAVIAAFLKLLDDIYTKYKEISPDYRLFFIVQIYSQQPDFQSLKTQLSKYFMLDAMTAPAIQLGPVSENDILDWLKKYSSFQQDYQTLYEEYFKIGEQRTYHMAEIRERLNNLYKALDNRK